MANGSGVINLASGQISVLWARISRGYGANKKGIQLLSGVINCYQNPGSIFAKANMSTTYAGRVDQKVLSTTSYQLQYHGWGDRPAVHFSISWSLLLNCQFVRG